MALCLVFEATIESSQEGFGQYLVGAYTCVQLGLTLYIPAPCITVSIVLAIVDDYRLWIGYTYIRVIMAKLHAETFSAHVDQPTLSYPIQ